MKPVQRILLKRIFEQRGSIEDKTAIGRESGRNWCGIVTTHGQGISAEDVRREATAANLVISLVEASKISKFLNEQKNATVEQAEDLVLPESVTFSVLETRLDDEEAEVGALHVQTAAVVEKTEGEKAASLFLDLTNKSDSSRPQAWIWQLSLSILCVSPLIMFSGLGGPDIVCGDKNQRECSEAAKIAVEVAFAAIFGLGSTVLTGAFTAFSMQGSAGDDRDFRYFVEQSFPGSRSSRGLSKARNGVEFLLGVFSSLGMMSFITSTLRYSFQLAEHGEEPAANNHALAFLNGVLLVLAGYACIRGNTGNMHKLHQRLYNRDWRQVLTHMRSFDQQQREALSVHISEILEDRERSEAQKYDQVFTAIMRIERGEILSRSSQNAILVAGAIIVAISAEAQYFIAGSNMPDYLSGVFARQFPSPGTSALPDSVGAGAMGVCLAVTNFMVMLNALLTLVESQFGEGVTPDQAKLRKRFKYGAALALSPAGAAVSQAFVLNPSSSVELRIWEILCAAMNAGQSWMFGVVGATFVLSKFAEYCDCCAVARRPDDPEAAPLLPSNAAPLLPSNTEAFDKVRKIVEGLLASSRAVPLPSSEEFQGAFAERTPSVCPRSPCRGSLV